MKREHAIYAIYMLALILLNGLIFATPLIAVKGDASALYKMFSYTCHQKISRSLCVFDNNSTNSYSIADCTPQNGKFIDTRADQLQTTVIQSTTVEGYKIPVCARDVGIYLAMLVAGIIYPFVRKLEDKEVYPTIYLVAAIVPLGIDGTVQLLSDFGILPFVYESTNEMRLLTGVIAGFALTFYAIPILVNMFGNEQVKVKQKKGKK